MNTSLWAIVLGWVVPSPPSLPRMDQGGLPLWEKPLAEQRRVQEEAQADLWKHFPGGY